MRVLITGGAGFMGHHLVDHLLRTTDAEMVSIDRLDTSGNLNRLTDLECWEHEKTRVKIIWHDLKSPISESLAKRIGPVDVILHLAASTHVDRSISDPMSFVMDNIVGTCNLLEYARTLDSLERFYFQSTDEVFGPAESLTHHPWQGFSGKYRDYRHEFPEYLEWDRYCASNPYSASKAGAEELCIAYHRTYDIPVLICHTMNLIGERQHLEKYCPSTIYKILHGEEVHVHAYPDLKRAGSRFYLHCRNLADGIMFLLKHGEAGDKYNVIGNREIDNLQFAQLIAEIIGKPLTYRMVDAHQPTKRS